MTAVLCGLRSVLTKNAAPYTRGYLSGTCIEPHGHGSDIPHRDASGTTWQESVR